VPDLGITHTIGTLQMETNLSLQDSEAYSADRPSASLCSWVVVRSGLLTLPFPSYAEDIRNDPVKVPEYRLESSPARIGMNS